MLTSSVLLVTALLADTASAHKEKGNDWDPAAVEALEAKVRSMFTDLDAANTDAIMSWADTPAITFDVGVDGKPLAGNTREESKEMLDGYSKWMKESGASVKTTVNKVDCHSTSDFGFCILQFDQVFTVDGAAQPPAKFRATLVARTVGGEWRWSHWHASSRESTTMAHDAAAH